MQQSLAGERRQPRSRPADYNPGVAAAFQFDRSIPFLPESAAEILRAGGYAKIKLVALEGVPVAAQQPPAPETPKP